MIRRINKTLFRCCWWILHFGWRCKKNVITENGAWNPDYPDYVTPRHRCTKCGREYFRGIYPLSPWSIPPNPMTSKQTFQKTK